MRNASNHSPALATLWRRSLVREIALILCIKALLLVAIRVAWFSDPSTDAIESGAVAEVIYSSPNRTEGALSPFHSTSREQP